MPLYEKTPQKHYPGCWRWSNHWKCAVNLVDRMAAAIEEMQESLAAEFGSGEAAGCPGLLMDAAVGLEAVLVEARAKGELPCSWNLGAVSFSFGKSRESAADLEE
jgi:hypothetical protein